GHRTVGSKRRTPMSTTSTRSTRRALRGAGAAGALRHGNARRVQVTALTVQRAARIDRRAARNPVVLLTNDTIAAGGRGARRVPSDRCGVYQPDPWPMPEAPDADASASICRPFGAIASQAAPKSVRPSPVVCPALLSPANV